LFIVRTPKLVQQDQCADLPYLLRFGVTAFWLKIQDLLDFVFREDMMTSANSFVKAKVSQQLTQLVECHTGI